MDVSGNGMGLSINANAWILLFETVPQAMIGTLGSGVAANRELA